jgi:hypothetical protein
VGIIQQTKDVASTESQILNYNSVRHLIFRLQELNHVNKVVICEIFPRFKLRKVKLDVYHEKKEKINLDFYLEFFHDPQIHFWRHGLVNRNTNYQEINVSACRQTTDPQQITTSEFVFHQ